jgi:ketosteroid isomerase-like protein
MSPIETDHHFFAALITADVPELERMLAPDFILIDLMSGSEISKADFLGLVASRQIEFKVITSAENRVRVYHATAVITGRTEMKGKLGDTPFLVHSRYTHVYEMEQNGWRLVSAQGTQINPPQES